MNNIYITTTAYNKMCQYILNTDLEISGLGVIEYRAGNPIITDIKIFEQEVSHAATDLDIDKLSDFLVAEDTAGVDISKYKVWWHSHNSMGAFFSATDKATIEQLGGTFDWLVAIVGNHKLEFKVHISIMKPFKTELEMPLAIVPDNANNDAVLKEIAEKVTEKVVTPAKTGVGFSRNEYGNYHDTHGATDSAGNHNRDYGDYPTSPESKDRGDLMMSRKDGQKKIDDIYFGRTKETFCGIKKCGGLTECYDCMEVEEYIMNEQADARLEEKIEEQYV